MQSMNVKNITVSWLTNLNNCNMKVNEKLKKKLPFKISFLS